MDKAVLFWSSGKDSSLALDEVAGELEIVALVTTVNRPERHVAVHRVPESLLDRQVSAIGLPLEKIVIPSPCPNEEYESRVLDSLGRFKDSGVDEVVFGDINLADIRAYREALAARAGMHCVFPLWGRDTRELAERQIASGIRAVVTCVDNKALSKDYAGREFDHAFLRSLPETADPCGENGEFHTFAFDAGMFAAPVPCTVARTFDDGAFSYAIMTEQPEDPNNDR